MILFLNDVILKTLLDDFTLSSNKKGFSDAKFFFFFWDNYGKPTCGMAHFHFAYPWFNHLHFAHLRLVLLAFRTPSPRLPLEKHMFRQKQI